MKQTITCCFIFIALLFAQKNVSAQYIFKIAGNDSCGHFGDGGLAVQASLNYPAGICRDDAGNLYISDGGTSGVNDARVRKIDAATGIITTIAGGVHLATTATDTVDNIAATSERLISALGICIDGSGNLLIVDHNIRKVNMVTGIITTVAGYGAAGYSGDGGPATAAQLYEPEDVAVDAANNIYIVDAGNKVIRKVTATTGIISTVAGIGIAGFSGDGGAATLAKLNSPTGIYVDSIGNLYISDLLNFRIRKVTAATGIITTIAGTGTDGFSGDGGPATAAHLSNVVRITMDKQANLYLADEGNLRIRKIDAVTGIISTYAGTGTTLGVDSTGDGSPATAADIDPYGMCFDPCGNMYFADTHCRIRAITATLPANGKLCGYNIAGTGIAPTGSPQVGAALHVWPSPNYGSFTINVSSPQNEPVQLTITNIVGQKIKEVTTATNKDVEVEMRVPKGMYFVSAGTASGVLSGKVVVQ